MLHLTRRFYEYTCFSYVRECRMGGVMQSPEHNPRPSPCASRLPPHPLRHFSSLLLADSSSPRMTDDYPSFGDSSLFGANAHYPFGPVRGGSAAIPTAGKVSERPCMRLHAGLLRRSLAPAPLPEDARRPG